MKNKTAIIDMGTNTFHLLIAEPGRTGYQIVYRERLPVKIGMGGINESVITDSGMERAISALKNFKSTVDMMKINHVLAFGTSALRSALNGSEVINRIQEETGILAIILSGEEEATYIYKGVQAAMPLGVAKSLIIDIGGGSVEFIIGNYKKIFWKQSVEIGGQRLLEKFQKHDPIIPGEIESLNLYFKEKLADLMIGLKEHNPKTMVGSSGTFETLSDIYCIKEDTIVTDNPETPLTLQAFHEIFEELLMKNREERLQIAGMIEMRVDMIVVCCCLIQYILNNHPFKNIRVSSYSLKEGIMSDL